MHELKKLWETWHVIHEIETIRNIICMFGLYDMLMKITEHFHLTPPF